MSTTFTKLYVTGHAAFYTPPTIQGTYDTHVGAITQALEAQISPDSGLLQSSLGFATTVAVSATSIANPYRFLLYRGVSGPLAAQTIGGSINICIGLKESLVGANFNLHLHVYVTQGNSDTPRGTLLANYEETGASLLTTATGTSLAAPQVLSGLAIFDNDRLVVEIGITARNTPSSPPSSFTATMNYGCLLPSLQPAPDLIPGDTSVKVKAGFISFTTPLIQAELIDRVTQTGVEVVGTLGTNAPSKMTQTGVEVVTQTSSVSSFVTQTGVELVYIPPLVTERSLIGMGDFIGDELWIE